MDIKKDRREKSGNSRRSNGALFKIYIMLGLFPRIFIRRSR